MSTTYTPPPELLERAAREIESATQHELAGARAAYEAYNQAVGGVSDGAPLPTWEQNPNALVKAGWLSAYQAVTSAAVAEVDEAVVDLAAQHKASMVRALADPRLPKLLNEDWLAAVRRMALGGVPEVLCMLVAKLLGVAEQHRQELAELHLSVGAAFNTMYEAGALTHGEQQCLEAAALRMEAVGFKRSAEILRLCARGEYSVGGQQ